MKNKKLKVVFLAISIFLLSSCRSPINPNSTTQIMPPMQEAKSNPKTLLLPNGKVLISSSETGEGGGDLELYEPSLKGGSKLIKTDAFINNLFMLHDSIVLLFSDKIGFFDINRNSIAYLKSSLAYPMYNSSSIVKVKNDLLVIPKDSAKNNAFKFDPFENKIIGTYKAIINTSWRQSFPVSNDVILYVDFLKQIKSASGKVSNLFAIELFDNTKSEFINTFQKIQSNAKSFHISRIDKNKLLIFELSSNEPISNRKAWFFDISSKHLSEPSLIKGLPHAPFIDASIQLKNGYILMVSGQMSERDKRIFLLNPDSLIAVNSGELSEFRGSPSLILLENGDVLIIGGDPCNGCPLKSAELFSYTKTNTTH